MLRRFLHLALSIAAALPAVAAHTPIDVSLEISAPSFIAAGQQFTYKITLITVSPGAAYAVNDTLPAALRFISAGGPEWNCLQSGRTISCGNQRLDESTSSFNIVVEAPASVQTFTNSATVESLSNFDPDLSNNSASVSTTTFAPANCDPRRVDLVAPADRAQLATRDVTLRWTPVPNALRYNIYATEDSPMLELIATTSDTQLVHRFAGGQFAGGDVQWLVEAITSDCPAISAAPQHFTIGFAPSSRRRAARH